MTKYYAAFEVTGDYTPEVGQRANSFDKGHCTLVYLGELDRDGLAKAVNEIEEGLYRTKATQFQFEPYGTAYIGSSWDTPVVLVRTPEWVVGLGHDLCDLKPVKYSYAHYIPHVSVPTKHNPDATLDDVKEMLLKEDHVVTRIVIVDTKEQVVHASIPIPSGQ